MNENKIEVFNSAEFGAVRTLKTEDGKVLFCGADVAKALGYKDTVNALKAHCKTDGVVIHHLIDSMGRTQQAKFITEGNVYRLITHSKLPNAERFEVWVFDEVLPTIRKHGAYSTAPDYSALSPQLQFLIQMEQKQKELEKAVQSTNRRIDDMCETMQVRGVNWRKATHSLVNRIASTSHKDPSEIYLDIYDEIEYRAGVRLSIRLENLRDRMYERGMSDSRIKRLNNVDVIAEDKKLIEIYIAVVKEMAVKCKAYERV
ncbi:MAG: hypothetical protein K2G63_05225 [Oscillospiraceae bacterium]|nr:hypothetical protein [Oscillospiraceae bacterium]